jgi:hypothetical protein
MDYKDYIKRLRRPYSDLPERVTNESLEPLLSQINDYLSRAEEHRRQYDRNKDIEYEKTPLFQAPRGRTIGYLATTPTEDERKALHKLYALCSPIIFSIVRKYDSVDDDILSDSYELFLRVVSNWKKENDFLHHLWDKLGRDIRDYMETNNSSTVCASQVGEEGEPYLPTVPSHDQSPEEETIRKMEWKNISDLMNELEEGL